jgi:hypothetical protein
VSISGGKTQSTEKRDSDDSDDGKIKIILASCASHETVGKKSSFSIPVKIYSTLKFSIAGLADDGDSEVGKINVAIVA